MDNELFELYTDFLISSFRLASALSLSSLTDGLISHDKVSRMLRSEEFSSKDLWEYSKATVRKIESEDAVLIFDDSIEKKPYTDENEIIAWHFDHTTGQNVKGINFVTGLYCTSEMSLPVCFELVRKTETYIDKETGSLKRKSKISKNEIVRKLAEICVRNRMVFSHILLDSWYSSSENMEYFKKDLKKNFICAVKSNRNAALSLKEKLEGKWTGIESLKFEGKEPLKIYIEGVSFPLFAVKKVFKNKDGSKGILYLVTSDSSLSCNDIITIYKKRWKVEEFHKSLKQNASLEKSPTKTVRTQSNHFFASMCAYVKLEILRCRKNLNHFALKARLYYNCLKSSFHYFHKINDVFA